MAEFNNGSGQDRPGVERRRRDDWVTRAITVFTGAGWLLAFLMFVLFGAAQPDTPIFLTRLFHHQVDTRWNVMYLWLTLIFLIAAFVACIFGVIFNLMRYRRKTDRFNKPLIFLSVVAAVGITMFLIRFWRYL
jgi:hypothetical protein